MAASTAANRPPRPMSAIAPSSGDADPVTVRRSIATCPAAAGPSRSAVLVVGRDLVGAPTPRAVAPLQGEHLLLLVGLGVVVAEQVQHPVHGQQRELVPERMSGRLSLFGGELRAQHDVAEHGRAGLGRVGTAAGLQLVHREAHHVGGAGQVHPAHVQIGHRRVSSSTIDSSAAGIHVHLAR